MYSVVLLMALSTGANAPDCHRGHGYSCCSSYSCYSCYGGYGYSDCSYYGGYGGYGGYAAMYPKAPNETDEEYQFCQEQSTKMSAQDYGTFRSEWVKMTNQERAKKKEEIQKKKSGGESFLPQSATIVVSLPVDARLTVDGASTTSVGTERVFLTPLLSPDGTYHYTFKAEFVREGKTVSVTKRVAISAGKETQVTFSNTADAGVVTASK